MPSVPMPRDLSEEAVAEWLHNIAAGSNPGMQVALRARAVRSLVEQKVREAVTATAFAIGLKSGETTDAIVSRVLGDHPAGGQGAEGDQVTRG